MNNALKATPSTLAALLAFCGLLIAFGIATPVSAQAADIHSGVVTEIETDGSAALTAFSIVSGDGTVQRISVSQANPNTEYGLENRVGDRWVSDQASEPQEAAVRLLDQQRRLAKITVQVDANGVATSVVQATSTDIDANLGYLFAVAAIAIICIAGYLVYVGLRQRTVAAQIERLHSTTEE